MRLNLADWEAKQDEIWAAGYPSTIVFFDRDFSHEGRSSTEGDKQLEALWRAGRDRVICGLLTHDKKDESEIAKELATLLGTADVVSVIAKRTLADPVQFALALRVYLAVSELKILRERIVSVLQESADIAAQSITAMSPFLLMAAFAAAKHEGQYEPDGMMRLATTILEKQLSLGVRQTDLREPIRVLRDLVSVRLRPFGIDRPPDFNDRLRSEKYLTGEELIELAAPVEVGDVFAFRSNPNAPASVTNVEHLYVVLVQPCDIALRPNGRRANALDTVLLAEISQRKVNDGSVKRLRPSQFDLGEYGDGFAQPWVLDVNKTKLVTTRALDACVLHPKGAGVLSTTMKAPVAVAQGWIKRAGELGKWCVEITERIGGYETSMADMKPKASKDAALALIIQGATLAGRSDSGVSVRVDSKKKTITFGVRRDGRIVGDVARSLMVAASQHRSRPDVENSSMMDIDEPEPVDV
jgi:hypothetical protein